MTSPVTKFSSRALVLICAMCAAGIVWADVDGYSLSDMRLEFDRDLMENGKSHESLPEFGSSLSLPEFGSSLSLPEFGSSLSFPEFGSSLSNPDPVYHLGDTQLEFDPGFNSLGSNQAPRVQGPSGDSQWSVEVEAKRVETYDKPLQPDHLFDFMLDFVIGGGIGTLGKVGKESTELAVISTVKAVKDSAKRSVDELYEAAGAVVADDGLNAAGRALQKHGGRQGSAFPPARGSPSSINKQGLDIVDDILNSPGSTTVTRHHARFGDVTEVWAPDGRGVRFGPDGKFIGFLEP